MLVGRDAERARLQWLLSDAREGRSGVLVVTGEAGAGSEATMPFGTLFDVCRPFLDSIGDLPDRQLPAPSDEC